MRLWLCAPLGSVGLPPQSESMDVQEAMAMAALPIPAVGICLGEAGKLSRVLNRRYNMKARAHGARVGTRGAQQKGKPRALHGFPPRVPGRRHRSPHFGGVRPLHLMKVHTRETGRPSCGGARAALGQGHHGTPPEPVPPEAKLLAPRCD